MEAVKKINEDVAVATCQLTSEQLQQAKEEGYQSVLNLRTPQEEGFVPNEAQQAEAVGLEYRNIPVSPENMNEELADRVLEEIKLLPKPILTHCKSGLRSGAMSLMYVATQEGMTAEEAMEKGKQLGFDCDKSPQMKEFFQQYISQHN